MVSQEKFKAVFSNSNIFEIVCFHKYNINNRTPKFNSKIRAIENGYYLNINLNHKSYSIDNCKILKKEIQNFNEIQMKFNKCYDYLNASTDTNDFKYRLYSVGNNWCQPHNKKYKKLPFSALWFTFAIYTKICIFYPEDRDLYFDKKVFGYDMRKNIFIKLYRDLKIFDVKTKKKGMNIFKNFIEKLNKI